MGLLPGAVQPAGQQGTADLIQSPLLPSIGALCPTSLVTGSLETQSRRFGACSLRATRHCKVGQIHNHGWAKLNLCMSHLIGTSLRSNRQLVSSATPTILTTRVFSNVNEA